MIRDRAMVAAICEFHRHIHGKTMRMLYDKIRMNAVYNRIWERRKMIVDGERVFTDEAIIAQCALAIIGNVLSDYHQRTNGEGKVYDEIELIFRDAKHFENHIGYAEEQKVTEAKAWSEYKAFRDGKPSKYAKVRVKPRERALIEHVEASQGLSGKELSAYREFARAIAPFFSTEVENKEIIEFIKTNESLGKFDRGLEDSEMLYEAITSAVKIFRPQGIPNHISQNMAGFVKVFCKLQAINA